MVFRVTLGILILYTLVLGIVFGFHSYFYVSCPADARVPCVNPVNYCSKISNSIEYFSFVCQSFERYTKDCKYSESPICTQDIIGPGTYVGDFPPFYIRYSTVFVIIILALAFGLNHVLYNRGEKQ